MADRYCAPPPGVRLSPDDHEWLIRFARHEDTDIQAVIAHALWFFRFWNTQGKKTFNRALEVIDLLCREYQNQLRSRCYLEREHRMLSRRLYAMRRAHEKQLWQERSMRHRHEIQLHRERSMRRAYENELHRQRTYDDQKERVATRSYSDAPYDPRVARLLALAVFSESDGEATAAFEKARELHRMAV